MVLVALAVMGMSEMYGKPEIDKFYGGMDSAISLEFDDAMNGQIDNALPLLNAKKIQATFFVNPGRPSWRDHRAAWESMPKDGHELGNHTMQHAGAKNPEELEKEIRECAEVLDKIYGKPRIAPFAHPGGVPWNVTKAEIGRAHV